MSILTIAAIAILLLSMLAAAATMAEKSEVDRDPQYRLSVLEYLAAVGAWCFIYTVAIIFAIVFIPLWALGLALLWLCGVVLECWDELMREAK